VAGFANAPALLGTCELEGEPRTAIGVVHAQVQNQGDGWAVTSGYLDRFVDEQRVLTSGEHRQEHDQLSPYQRLMSQTGRRLAELHLALASHPELSDFAPEPIRAEQVEQWITDMLERAAPIFEIVKKHRDNLKEGDQALVDQFLALRATLHERLRTLLPANLDGFNIRHHGDFRLSQILIVKDDVVIIDFEGDPRQPLAERRRKAPAARDVAGLIRSIDYSVTAALERALKGTVDEQGKLAAALSNWRAGATEAFLAGYNEMIAGQRLWPADPRTAQRLLGFFLLEKALGELEYELSRRSEGLRVPLSAVLRILSEPADEAA
jgi:maltose alpha-D-glucosyltransferase/alpha-amylase